MSEEQQGSESAGDGGEAGGIPLTITQQYIKDFSFENPSTPGIFLEATESAPEISLNVNVGAERLTANTFEVLLHVEARAQAAEATLFIAELDYAGIVEVGEVPEEHLHPLILIEVPRLLFPFARSIISSVTSDGGYPPLLISGVDFVELYRQNMAAASESQSGGDGN